ncbi:argininosuccinate synthase [Parvularcula marina]|uniref:argininosuccinate synthase n=1 Tax=Parvularcula marina TaxID=2292771 RepID=A0A371REY6_9PROT|nr:argininosuccinate synthase [Parvularcula marina]RFB04018.1 argininosuccinate synthase [Parvularcula marina]
MSKGKVVLAFSGGLDTSYCVVWLKEQGWDVVTYFVDTAGPGSAEASPEEVEARAKELGAVEHHSVEAAGRLWDEIVTPLIRAGEWRQGRYPLLCADRYLIVKLGVEIAKKTGADAIAHGCTGMGNDQVRFDRSIAALGGFKSLAPIREVPRDAGNVREYERKYLEDRGFEVPASQKLYTINQNLLGTTFSGREIDDWKTPSDKARSLTKPAGDWPSHPLELTIQFENGVAVAIDGQPVPGPDLLSRLNREFGAYGVGYGTYTGDTLVGLKGRIAFEAPGLIALEAAHRALEQGVFTMAQNDFKPMVARKWADLVYDGGYFDPLRSQIEDFITSTQERVTGNVTLMTSGGRVDAVEITSDYLLRRDGATYAQAADWTAEEATGFIKLVGQSAALWTLVGDKD